MFRGQTGFSSDAEESKKKHWPVIPESIFITKDEAGRLTM